MTLSLSVHAKTLRVATFNVSLEATNYLATGEQASGRELFTQLENGENPQIRNIAEIIQRVGSDVILLNEFDYHVNPDKGIKAFIKRYLKVAQHEETQGIDYPYFYTAPVNTGVDSGLDLDKDGIASGKGGDAFGFGFFPGHYGMALLSKYPIDLASIRTFQHFLWKDMPDGLLDSIKDETGQAWYSAEAKKIFRLSSKSHWDLPIQIGDEVVHILASHPTPPVFDGPEDKNGKRNHDEVRFWLDYIVGGDTASYIYDDNKQRGGLGDKPFVIMGDLNSSPDEGDAHKGAITALLAHPLVNNATTPSSVGGKQHRLDNSLAKFHTADWGMRADYVLPSVSLNTVDSGVFWPSKQRATHRLVQDRSLSSDHRLVWIDIAIDDDG
jgi:endonuclease/exonuclease/phosphatase family metal-dependent hydrolase